MRRGSERELHLQFLRSPEQILPRAPGSSDAGSVRLQVNRLQPRLDGGQQAVGTGRYETLPVRHDGSPGSPVLMACMHALVTRWLAVYSCEIAMNAPLL